MEPGPRAAEDAGVALEMGVGRLFVLVLKEQAEVLRRKNVVELAADRMNGVKRDRARGNDNSPEGKPGEHPRLPGFFGQVSGAGTTRIPDDIAVYQSLSKLRHE